MVEEEEFDELQEDEYEEQLEDQIEKQQDLMEDMSPSLKQKDDLYSLFWKVVKTRESSKVGNLNEKELGMLNISVRDCQKIALLAYKLNHKGFGDFFLDQGEITLATSASRKGWLPELFVSQRKFQTKARKKQQEEELQPVKRRKKLFS